MEEMINEARSDERLNRAAVFAARLEALACFINKHDLSGKEAAEAQRRRDLAEHCRDARQMRAQVESGVRIAKFDAKGERSFLTDEERSAQLARVNKALAQCR